MLAASQAIHRQQLAAVAAPAVWDAASQEFETQFGFKGRILLVSEFNQNPEAVRKMFHDAARVHIVVATGDGDHASKLYLKIQIQMTAVQLRNIQIQICLICLVRVRKSRTLTTFTPKRPVPCGHHALTRSPPCKATLSLKACHCCTQMNSSHRRNKQSQMNSSHHHSRQSQ